MTNALAAVRSTAAFYAACAAMIENSPHVKVDLGRIDSLVPLAASAKRVSWSWYLSKDTNTLADALFEFTFNAALNGGYFEMQDGKVRQWQSKGSGSQALLEWIQSISASKMRPGIDVIGGADACATLVDTMQGQPFLVERLAICAEFADPKRRAALDEIAVEIAADIERGAGAHFDMDQINRLVAIYPAGFGQDPFRKKAILAIQMFAGWLDGRPGPATPIAYDLPIPSDYQIPRILAWKGAIEVSDAFAAKIRNTDALLDASSEEVMHMRAAAALVAHALAQAADVTDDVVDGALFTTFRKDPAFQAEALPPMRCASLWF